MPIQAYTCQRLDLPDAATLAQQLKLATKHRHKTIQHEMNLALKSYEGISEGENIEKHASAPLYMPGLKHPHPQYRDKERLTINMKCKYLEKLEKRINDKMDKGKLPRAHWLDHVKVKDLDGICKCDHKYLYEQIIDDGFNTDHDTVMAYKSCAHTIFAAGKRQMKAAPTPDPQVADDFYMYSKNLIDKEVGEELRHFQYSFLDWYQHLATPKQAKIDQYLQYLAGTSNLTQTQIKECESEIYEGICKIEMQKSNGKPRMVCAIPLKFKYIMGPITWKLEQIFNEKFKGYCGGKNLQEMTDMVNKYIDQGFTKIVEGDGSAFDNTQDITLKRVDHYIYEQVEHAVYHTSKSEFHRISHLDRKTMSLNYFTPKRTKKTLLQYTILGSVFSGDCDTTLANTIRMALYNRYVNDKAGLQYGKDYIAYSKGDDFTIQYKPYITDQKIHDIYYKYFVTSLPEGQTDTRVFGLGQVLKMLDIGGPNTIKFCSLRAWYKADHTHIILTRDPSKLFDLSQFSRKIKAKDIPERIEYHMTLAESYQTNFPGITIFELQAKLHEAIARILYYDKNNKVPSKPDLMKIAHDVKQKRLSKQKVTRQELHKINSDVLLENDIDHVLYEIKRAKNIQQMYGGWWDYMQMLFYKTSYTLSHEDLDCINRQIETEFDIDRLKFILCSLD